MVLTFSSNGYLTLISYRYETYGIEIMNRKLKGVSLELSVRISVFDVIITRCSSNQEI